MENHTRDGLIAEMQESTVKLIDVSFERIRSAGIDELYHLAVIAGIPDDERLVHCEDLRERLILVKRKMEGSHHTWKELFQSVREETHVKRESLLELMKTVEKTFQTCPLNSLSEILRQEGHVHSHSLLQELSKRMKSLRERRSLVVIAGETNGGKSSFLNLLLGEDILPTDVLHCTFSVCKIVYSHTYSIKTLDYDDQEEYFPCSSQEEVKTILRSKLAQQEVRERLQGSPIKEMTLGLPSDILKSGVTLVDTPGIGEDENMDNVTMNFVKSTHASAFIYIIKSDTSGGIQEDRLLSFLQAIKERYSGDTEMEAFDPRAAMFVCHRWDNIEEHNRDKVKQNALQKLEFVWPGFQPAQTYFFSTTDTKKHLPVDPHFVTDSFMILLQGMKKLFDRASHNAIKHQYLWLKYMLPSASHHLKSMITHCIHNNEELEIYFRNVVHKQNKLMASSTENSRKLQSELDALSQDLKHMIVDDLNFDTISVRSEINSVDDIIALCCEDSFLYDKSNRRQLDEMIIRCLLKYVDEHVHDRKIVAEIESHILSAIQDHLGLFKCQINQIKYVLQHGGNISLTPSSSRTNMEVDDEGSQLGASINSVGSDHSSFDAFREDVTLDTSKLALQVKGLLLRRKDGKSWSSVNSKHEFQESLLSKVKSKIRLGILHKLEPAAYVEERVRKVARDIRSNSEIMESIVSGYTEWIQRCVSYATNSIPKFIDVNNKLMDEIREHRSNFQRDKDLLRHVMDDLEPCRHNLRGYGLLYMDDINAEMLAFNVSQRNSSVFLPRDLTADHRPNDDSGFLGSGSKQRNVQSLWAKMQGATIKIDNEAERVIVKTYIYDMDERAVLSEIASLRCLEYTNLASFLGMTRIKASGSTLGQTANTENMVDKVSAFIFKGDLVSAYVYSKRKMTNMQLFVPDLIHNLLQGLNYIHREGLVHMELNLDTVMVERLTGNVKLCHMCKPREARFPTSPSAITRTCVCLSPNVLQGHEYEITDDIYAFGLLLWELLFPDQQPYKQQRFWLLKRFIDECHPVNMLQDDLMKLEASEAVLEILKGTLLVSRKSICMPITTVQSLMADISDEPAVKKLRSRQEQHPVRRLSPVYGSDLLMENPVVKLPTEPSPQRPPRKKDIIKSFNSTEEPEMNNRKPSFPVRSSRRQSEPAIFTNQASLNLRKPKKKFSRVLGGLFGRGSTKTLAEDVLHESDDSVSLYLSKSRKASTTVQDHTDTTVHESKSNDDPSFQQKPSMAQHNTRQDAYINVKSQGRRFSLQDQSLFGPRKVSLMRDESFDVPFLMSQKFSKNFGNTLLPVNRLSVSSKSHLQSDAIVSYSMSSSVSASSSRSSTPEIDQKQTIFDFRDKRSNFTSVAPKDVDTFVSPDSRHSRHSLPENITRRLGLVTGRSLEDISPRQTKLLPIPSALGRPVSHQTSDFQPVGQQLRWSLQDISSVSHAIEPIMEDKVQVSYHHGLAKYGGAIHNGINKSLKNYRLHRASPPEVVRQTLTLGSSFQSADALEEENVGSSSSLASSCSSSSLSVSSGFSIQVPSRGQTILGANTVDDFSPTDMATSSEASSNVTASLSQSLRNVHVLGRDQPQLTSDYDTSQRGSRSQMTIMAPPPPEINFSKLTFERYDSSEEED